MGSVPNSIITHLVGIPAASWASFHLIPKLRHQTITKQHHVQVQQPVDHQQQTVAKDGIIRSRKGQQIPDGGAVFVGETILRQKTPVVTR